MSATEQNAYVRSTYQDAEDTRAALVKEVAVIERASFLSPEKSAMIDGARMTSHTLSASTLFLTTDPFVRPISKASAIPTTFTVSR